MAAEPSTEALPERAAPRGVILAALTLLLFVVWSNSFIVFGFLLGRDGAAARFDYVGLTVARFVTAASLCTLYLLTRRRRETLALLRAHPGRLIACGFLMVPSYNLALYYAQQRGVSAPVASLTTTLVPLFVMLLAAAFLGERLTLRRVGGFLIAASGMALIAMGRPSGSGVAYPLLVAVAAVAPLSWSVYSVLSKPLAGRVSPVVWSYTATVVGTLMVLPLAWGRAGTQWRALDLTGWLGLLYLAVPCTVLGFALWTWLLRYLPATTVGFTVFLNPPLTTTSKFLLATFWPSFFAFAITGREWWGGLLTLCGLALAVYRRSPRRRPAATEATESSRG